MATRTRNKAGVMSDTTGYVGAVIPVDGDTLDLAAFDVTADYSLTGTGLTLANTGAADAHLIMGSGNINVTIAGVGTLTHKAIVQGSPSYLENTNGTPAGVINRGQA
jgi:hypothetical protein